MEVAFQDGGLVFLRTPGANDLLTLRPADEPVHPDMGGLQHLGFDVDAKNFDAAVAEVEAAGVEVLSTGRHGGAQGPLYAYIKDPDGYIIEL